MSTLNVNNINEVGGVDAVITAGVLDSGSLPAGSVLQVVRATDTTDRVITSTSFVDVPGISVTITPSSASNKIILMLMVRVVLSGGSSNGADIIITDSSNVAVSGAEGAGGGFGLRTSTTERSFFFRMGQDTAGSTSAKTYKVRAEARSGTTLTFANNPATGQLYAIEVAA